jgi:hypothetical protein
LVNAALEKYERVAASGLGRAEVLSVGEESLTLAWDDEIVEATTAPSCLLSPEPGDEALCFRDERGASLLAVLRRARPRSEATLALPAAAAVTGGRLRLSARRLSGSTEETVWESGRLGLKGTLAAFNFKVAHLAAGLVSSILGSVLGRYGEMTLEVKRDAVMKSRRLRIGAEEDLTVRSGEMDLKAEGVVKMDGKTVSLG